MIDPWYGRPGGRRAHARARYGESACENVQPWLGERVYLCQQRPARRERGDTGHHGMRNVNDGTQA